MRRHPLVLDIETKLASYEFEMRNNVRFAITKVPGLGGRNDELERVLMDVLVDVLGFQHKHFKIVVEKLLKLFEEGGKIGTGGISIGKMGLSE